MSYINIAWIIAIIALRQLSAEIACSFWRIHGWYNVSLISQELSTMDDCFRSCYENVNCMYNEYKNDKCSIFASGDVKHSFKGEAYTIGRDKIDESCEREVVLDESRLTSLPATMEVDSQTSMTDDGGTESQTISAADLAGWIYYDAMKMCYKKFDVPVASNEAEEYCNGYDGHLASIHSMEHNQFLLGRSKKSFVPALNQEGNPDVSWIGLRLRGPCDPSSRLKYWWDGSDVNFQYWNEGEPNNVYCIENSTAMQPEGKWADYPDYYSFNFICQTESIVYCSKHIHERFEIPTVQSQDV
ncbi:lectin C-type domain protein [Necator americanus]|uniref:Lectin C-type domain protein n=1 Tax=Necator americanus TaxID=51031 RepID=W2SXU9_NECAM|nr:lectin C-type domain protein [Necator americanus]ETN73432.1 lectin C-type domain protein [Necator americanus]